MEIMIKLGGVFHIVCALSHIIFPKLFGWNQILNKLSVSDKIKMRDAVLTSNYLTPLFWMTFAVLSLLFTHDMISTAIGKAILGSISVIWFIRIAILYPVFSGFKTKLAVARVAFFILGFMLYLIPAIKVLCVD